MADLLAECAQYIIDQFVKSMPQDTAAFLEKLPYRPLKELYLVTSEYLTPYLRYIKENQRLFRTGREDAATLRLEDSYAGLFRHVIAPILDRYGVPQQDRPYLMAFYLHGLIAIILEWLKNGCAKPIEYPAVCKAPPMTLRRCFVSGLAAHIQLFSLCASVK